MADLPEVSGSYLSLGRLLIKDKIKAQQHEKQPVYLGDNRQDYPDIAQ